MLPCDQEGIEDIHDATGVDWTEGQLGHRTEHSAEFQAVFLRYLFPDREIKIIPVLCSSFADLMENPEGPMGDDSIRIFIETLRSLLVRRPHEVALIAGADLSHVGPKFGHPDPLQEADLISLKRHDLSLIRHVEEGNPEGFFKEIQKEMALSLVIEEPGERKFINFSTETLRYKEESSPDYPITLMIESDSYYYRSLSFRHKVKSYKVLRDPDVIGMNPEDMKSQNIASGEEVAVISSYGRIKARAMATENIKPGTASMVFHLSHNSPALLVRPYEQKVCAVRVEKHV